MKRLLCVLLFTFSSMSAEPFKLIEDQAKLPILTPSMKEQKKKKIELKNGLQALLISDPEADQSGAVLSVNVGSWSDPKEHPGLAHFLEHMLFLGTTKYPEESGYFRYIGDHGGLAEAFTTPTATSYFFTVDNNGLPEALDRFSYFFKEPLFNPSGVDRELQAVNQEYGKNIENDRIRQYYIQKELANKNHPHSNFNMGNKISLANASQQILKEWYQEHYSANLMKLVVYSDLPLDELQQMVIKDFGAIPNHNTSPLKVSQFAASQNLEGKMVYIEPIKETQKLTVVWELPKKFASMLNSQPESLVCYILGHEGERSLLANLKEEHLAESLSCGGLKTGNDLMEIYLEIGLTRQGLNEIDQVITKVFQSIEMLKKEGIPRYIFDEVNRVSNINYKYQSKKPEYDFLEMHAFLLHNEPLATYPEKSRIIQTYDPKAINELISYLTPKNARFYVMAPSKKTHVPADQQEKWIGGKYGIKEIDANTMNRWELVSADPDIALPTPNPFIPKNLNLIETPQKSEKTVIPHPESLFNDDSSQIFFAKDVQFGIPKVLWTFTIRTPEIEMSTPSKIVQGDLFVKLVEDALNKYSYPAQMAGLEYTIERVSNGIKIKIGGYSENAHLLFAEVLNTLKTLTPTEKKFRLFKESLSQKYRNFEIDTPTQQAIEHFKSALYLEFTTEKEKAAAIPNITFDSFQKWHENLFRETYIEGMIYGNLSQEKALKVTEIARSTFFGTPYLKKDHEKDKVVVFSDQDNPLYLEYRTQSQGNVALLAIENPHFSFKKRAAQQILMQGIKEPFFSTLRTKQQTGYIVHSLDQEIEKKLFNLFLVQSTTHDPRDLLSRFETFIEGYVQELGKTEFTKEQFEGLKHSLKESIEQNPKNLTEMGELLYLLAFKYDGDFDWMQQRIDAFETLTYGEFLVMAKDFLGKSNKRRLAILIRGQEQDENLFMYEKARNLSHLKKSSLYE